VSHRRLRLGCFCGTFKPSARPDTFHPLVVHLPAFSAEHCRDGPVAVAAELLRQNRDTAPQTVLLDVWLRIVALGGSWLLQGAADTALGVPEAVLDLPDGPASFSRAQKFPREASLRMALSMERSAMTFRSLVFSVSNSFRRLA